MNDTCGMKSCPTCAQERARGHIADFAVMVAIALFASTVIAGLAMSPAGCIDFGASWERGALVYGTCGEAR